MRNSNDYRAEDAISRIGTMKNIEEIKNFIEGEERKTVVSAAEARIKELSDASQKQGEQKEPITQRTDDFKEGIQRTKSGIGDQGLGVSEETNPQPPVAIPRSYVTCEDVIKKMREQGKKI